MSADTVRHMVTIGAVHGQWMRKVVRWRVSSWCSIGRDFSAPVATKVNQFRVPPRIPPSRGHVNRTERMKRTSLSLTMRRVVQAFLSLVYNWMRINNSTRWHLSWRVKFIRRRAMLGRNSTSKCPTISTIAIQSPPRTSIWTFIWLIFSLLRSFHSKRRKNQPTWSGSSPIVMWVKAWWNHWSESIAWFH